MKWLSCYSMQYLRVVSIAWCVSGVIRELKQLWRQCNENGKNWQNNNTACASCFFVHFFSVTARLWHENANFMFCGWVEHKTTFFFFSWTSIQSFRIQLQKNCQHLRKELKNLKFEVAQLHFFKWCFVVDA